MDDNFFLNQNRFLAIYFTKDPKQLLKISNSIMQWGDAYCVVDLKPCFSYWAHKARSKSLAVTSVLRSLVDSILLSQCTTKEPITRLKPGYYATLSDSPVSACLLLKHLVNRNLQGLISRHTPTGKSLFLGLQWQSWWSFIESLKKLSMDGRVRGFINPKEFRKSIPLFERSLTRLGATSPRNLAKFSQNSLKRRFGSDIAQICEWAFGNPQNQGLFESHIWRSYIVDEAIFVSETLDFATSCWKEIEQVLGITLDRLAQKISYEAAVSSLVWQINYADMQKTELCIHFRQPYSIHRDKKRRYTAALTQFQAAYEAEQHKVQNQVEFDDDFIATRKTIVSWKIHVSNLFLPTVSRKNLFDSLGDETLQEIANIENKIKVPLLRFGPTLNWLPEHSCSEDSEMQSLRSSTYKTQILNGNTRPLYIFQPKQIDISSFSHKPVFLEEVGGNWWEDPLDTVRYYYKIRSHKGKILWVFKNSNNVWFLNGEFS